MDNEDKAPDSFSVDFYNTDYLLLTEIALHRMIVDKGVIKLKHFNTDEMAEKLKKENVIIVCNEHNKLYAHVILDVLKISPYVFKENYRILEVPSELEFYEKCVKFYNTHIIPAEAKLLNL